MCVRCWFVAGSLWSTEGRRFMQKVSNGAIRRALSRVSLHLEEDVALGHSQYHTAVAGGCARVHTHPLPRCGTDCVQVPVRNASSRIRVRRLISGFADDWGKTAAS